MIDDKKFILERFIVGPIEVNAYVLADPATREACLIDPGGDEGRLSRFIDENNLKLKFIINTHGHGDHIASNGYFKAPVYIHRLDKDCLTDKRKNLSSLIMLNISSPPASKLLEDGDEITMGSMKLKVIHTPGHTPGSISIKTDDIIFTGDTLFAGAIGRTDLPGGDGELMLKSIKHKLMIFSDDTVIYPGHGDLSTIGAERKSNPYLQKEP